MSIFGKKDLNEVERKYVTESDFKGYDAYVWHMYSLYWKTEASRTVKWQKVDAGYYKAELDSGDVIFYDDRDNSCRIVSKEEALYSTEDLWLREFARRLNRRMELKGLNQYDLSELTGLSQSSLSGYCTGKRPASSYTVRLLARVLDCSIEYLIDF